MLTVKQIEAFKPTDKLQRKSVARGGLYIFITPQNSKQWYLRYKLEGITSWYKLGNYPEMSLKEANAQFILEKQKVSQGLHLQAIRTAERKKPVIKKWTFRKQAEEWIKVRQSQCKEVTWNKDWSRVERFLFPKFAEMKLDDIDPNVIKTGLTTVANSKATDERNRIVGGRDTARRTLQSMVAIIDMGIAFGHIKYNVARGLHKYLPKHTKKKTKAITSKNIEALGQVIWTLENDTRKYTLVGCACRLMPHIFVRHSEMLTHMKWADIDFKKKEWNLKVQKTKDRGVDENTIYLSEQVIAILQDIRKLTGNYEHVFHSNEAYRYGVISQGSTTKRLHQVRISDYTLVQGMRATARSVGVDKLKTIPRVIEICLSHVTKEELGDIYDRADYVPERKKFMQDWSDYLMSCKSEYQRQQMKSV